MFLSKPQSDVNQIFTFFSPMTGGFLARTLTKNARKKQSGFLQ
jgi:hypothetical protein